MTQTCPYLIDRFGTDVHSEGRNLNDIGSLVRVELPGGLLAWSVTTRKAATQLMRDPRISKNSRQHWPDFYEGRLDETNPLIGWAAMNNMTTSSGAEHARLRRMIAKAFTPRRVDLMRPRIERIVNELLDDLAARDPSTPVDIKRSYAYQLPAQVICELFGIPKADRVEILRGGEINIDTRITPEEARANLEQWHVAMSELVEHKRSNLGDDLTSDLITVRDAEGSVLTHDELVGSLHLMLGAGSETVMNLLSHAILKMATRPADVADVRSGRRSWGDVIEETLRVESPVAQLPFRYALEDIEVDGTTIHPNEPIMIGYGAIGRDRDFFGPDADAFDIWRENKDHMSFGNGVHFCVGAPLARLEAELALPALFDRFPHLQLAVPTSELEPQGTFIMNGHRELPVLLGEPAQLARTA